MNTDNTIDSSAPQNYSQNKFKIVFLGDQGVGKTSIIKRFIYDTFDESNAATIGVDLISKTVTLQSKTIRLNLWDTAGQEKFRCLIPGYIRDAGVAIIVYDITKPESFDHVKSWVDEVKEARKEEVLIAVIGCKSDLSDERQVPDSEGKKIAQEYNGLFKEVSAKSGANIQEFFQDLVVSLVGDQEAQDIKVD